MNPGSSRNHAAPKTDSETTHLPNEILKYILLELSYAEIAKVRQVCRQFRDLGDKILDREFLYLQTRVENHRDAIAKIGPPCWKPLSLFFSDNLLETLGFELRLLRALCYRPLFLSQVPQDARLSTAYFKGNIIDVTHRILRLVTSRWFEKEIVQLDVSRFISLVDPWMNLFYVKVDAILIPFSCSQNRSDCAELFGSKIVDLIGSIPENNVNIIKNMNSGGWCYIKAEYIVGTAFPLKLPCLTSARKPMSVKQQAKLEYALFNLARFECHHYFLMLGCKIDLIEDSKLKRYLNIGSEKLVKPDYVFELDLKCREELVPVELLKLTKEQSCENSEDESASAAHTVQDPSLDFELKLTVTMFEVAGKPKYVYKYLIRHTHTER
jgi:hypothetical protein